MPARTRHVAVRLGILVGVLGAVGATGRAAAQTGGASSSSGADGPQLVAACYVPTQTTSYRIDTPDSPTPGAPKGCVNPSHVRFTWSRLGVVVLGAPPADASGSGARTGDPGFAFTPATVDGVRVRSANGARLAFGQTSAATMAPPAVPAGTAFIVQSTNTNVFKVDTGGGFVAYGFVRDVGNTTGCAAQIPATGAGTRFEWFPCRGSIRFGRVPTAQTNWDDANMNDFTFGGGNQVTASGYGAFAYGDQVNVSSTVGVGFGSAVTVSGTAGFSAGASNVCSGFACTAIGYTVRAGGQGSIALGYRTTANNDYSTAMGYRASNNTHTGTFVWGDESTTDSVRNQADNEFRIRANGGIRLRVSTASNGNSPGAAGNVGCDLTVAVPSWTCASSRWLKRDFHDVDGETVLGALRAMPVTTWEFITDTGHTRHMGPVAQDFRSAFGLGIDSTSIGVSDVAGVALAAAKALDARTRDLESASAALDRANRELASLRSEMAALRTRTDSLASENTALRSDVEMRLRRLESAAPTSPPPRPKRDAPH